jgi:hypothetical protein
VQVVQILAMNQEIQHVVSLLAHLQASLSPIQLCGLEKLGGSQ